MTEYLADPRTHLLSEGQLRLLQGAIERCVSGQRIATAAMHQRDMVEIARGITRINEALADVADVIRRIGGGL